jgi:hypothetical protein
LGGRGRDGRFCGAAVVGERVALWQATRIRLNKRMRVIKWGGFTVLLSTIVRFGKYFPEN